MPLKRSNNYPTIIETVLILVVLVGGAGLFVAHLILAGDWGGVFSPLGLATGSVGLLFFFVVFGLTFILYAYFNGLLWRKRTLNAGAQGESHLLTTLSEQPDQELALRLGETLTLDRRRGLGSILAMSGFILFFVVFLIFSGEVIVFSLLPAFSHSALNPFYFLLFAVAPPPKPSLLDWVTAAYPLAVGLLLLAVIPVLMTDQRYTLVADDEGITIRQRLHRRRFMPWNDMALFVQTGKARGSNVSDVYVLWGREYQVTFVIVRLLQASGASRIEKLDRYRFEGGFDRYASDAQRLLATIAARSHTRLQILVGQPALVARLKRRAPNRLTLDDLAAAPQASQEMQPDVPEGILADAAMPELTLKERLPLGPVLLESAIWFIVFSVLVFWWADAAMPTALSNLSEPLLAVVVAIILAFIALNVLGLVLPRRQRRLSPIIANLNGLTWKTDQKATTITIPWAEVRAWAILATPDYLQTRRTYVVCSERATITWTERTDAKLGGRGVQGDRRLAYQGYADQLHRLIASLTGLPLREVTNQPNAG